MLSLCLYDLYGKSKISMQKFLHHFVCSKEYLLRSKASKQVSKDIQRVSNALCNKSFS